MQTIRFLGTAALLFSAAANKMHEDTNSTVLISPNQPVYLPLNEEINKLSSTSIWSKPYTTEELLIDAATSKATARKGVLIIGNPRSLTTALERYFMSRSDFKIYHEPVIRHRFSQAVPFVTSPYPENFDSGMILQQIYDENKDQSFLIKEMAWSLHDSSFLTSIPDDMRVIFVIRRPEQAIVSHAKLYDVNQQLAKKLNLDLSFNPTLKTMNYDLMKDIFDSLFSSTNETPILIDADDLANDPKAVIEQLCSKIGIEFNPNHLRWDIGESALWPYTKETWQKDVTESREFTPLKNAHKLTDLDPKSQSELSPLIAHDEVVYKQLTKHKLGVI